VGSGSFNPFFISSLKKTLIDRHNRVARWYICTPKIPIWVYVVGSGTWWEILRPFDIFYDNWVCMYCGHLVHFPVLQCDQNCTF
jgi:hypothetical protein